jgi:TetR/AcrR family transcriptional regulator, mexJK operon transcriptional repressor
MTRPHISSVNPPSAKTRILDAARALFFAEGFSAVSTDRLSREAGVSKSTIYKYFGDMVGVLTALVTREGDHYALDFDLLPETAPAFWSELAGFGTRLLTLINSDFCVQCDRMLHEEARRNPELVRQFYDVAYGRGHAAISALLDHGKARGFVHKPQSAVALADNLLCMWEGLASVRSRLGLPPQPHAAPAMWSRQCIETLFPESAAQ